MPRLLSLIDGHHRGVVVGHNRRRAPKCLARRSEPVVRRGGTAARLKQRGEFGILERTADLPSTLSQGGERRVHLRLVEALGPEQLAKGVHRVQLNTDAAPGGLQAPTSLGPQLRREGVGRGTNRRVESGSIRTPRLGHVGSPPAAPIHMGG